MFDGFDFGESPLLGLPSSVPSTEVEDPESKAEGPPVVVGMSSSNSRHTQGAKRGRHGAKKRDPPARDWMLTWNNPPADADDIIRGWPNVGFVKWQHERGDSGTEHVQLFVQFSTKKYFNFVRSLCPTGHWEKRKGSVQSCIDYVGKDLSRVRLRS